MRRAFFEKSGGNDLLRAVLKFACKELGRVMLDDNFRIRTKGVIFNSCLAIGRTLLAHGSAFPREFSSMAGGGESTETHKIARNSLAWALIADLRLFRKEISQSSLVRMSKIYGRTEKYLKETGYLD